MLLSPACGFILSFRLTVFKVYFIIRLTDLYSLFYFYRLTVKLKIKKVYF